MPVARPTLLIALLCAGCPEPGLTEVSSWAEGDAPPAPNTDDPLALTPDEACDLDWGGGGHCDECGGCCASEECLVDPDPNHTSDEEWEEFCSWASDLQECNQCGGGGCEAGPDPEDVDGGVDGGPVPDEGPWATDDECDEWYGGGGFCEVCDDCCAAEGCAGEEGDESTWTDQECDDRYGGGGWCLDCVACCWSDGCETADDLAEWTDEDCNDWYGSGGFCVECNDCCESDACLNEVEDESEWTDQDCDDRYGGGGWCLDCFACCRSDGCDVADDTDESDWTDQECDDWYGGGAWCLACNACCWSEGCL